jgi:hypothetical protein
MYLNHVWKSGYLCLKFVHFLGIENLKKTLNFSAFKVVFSLFGYKVELANKSLLLSSQPSSALFLPRARTDDNQGLS